MASTLYASGSVAVLEMKLLKREKYSAMINASSLEESVKVLHDAGYASSNFGDAKNFEKALQSEFAENVRIFKELAGDKKTVECIVLPFDYHNLKTLLKAQVKSLPLESISDVLYSGGLYDVNTLQNELALGGKGLRPRMREVIERADSNPKNIDVLTDVAMYKDIASLLRGTKSRVVVNYYKKLFDFVNISTVVRNKLAGITGFANQIIEGGNIKKEVFIKAINSKKGEFLAALNALGYVEIANMVKSSVENYGNLVDFERYYHNQLFKKLWENKINFESVAPLIYYFFAKITEINNIRLILTCKKNKVNNNMIHQRLRETYA